MIYLRRLRATKEREGKVIAIDPQIKRWRDKGRKQMLAEKSKENTLEHGSRDDLKRALKGFLD